MKRRGNIDNVELYLELVEVLQEVQQDLSVVTSSGLDNLLIRFDVRLPFCPCAALPSAVLAMRTATLATVALLKTVTEASLENFSGGPSIPAVVRLPILVLLQIVPRATAIISLPGSVCVPSVLPPLAMVPRASLCSVLPRVAPLPDVVLLNVPRAPPGVFPSRIPIVVESCSPHGAQSRYRDGSNSHTIFELSKLLVEIISDGMLSR